jgi:oxygen-independent coproporphyrinogen-3 oxidase
VLEGRFGATVVDEFRTAVEGLVDAGLLESTGTQVQLTARGRLLSNEVFERFISAPAPVQ